MSQQLQGLKNRQQDDEADDYALYSRRHGSSSDQSASMATRTAQGIEMR
jgi:hypothetical protein